jgi:hypothetical protein
MLDSMLSLRTRRADCSPGLGLGPTPRPKTPGVVGKDAEELKDAERIRACRDGFVKVRCRPSISGIVSMAELPNTAPVKGVLRKQ